MKRKFLLILAAASALALAGLDCQAQTTQSSAQPAAAASKPATSSKASSSKFTVDDTPLGELLDDPNGRAVLAKYWGKDALQDPQLELAREMTLRQLSEYPQSQLSEETLKSMDADLAKLTPAAK